MPICGFWTYNSSIVWIDSAMRQVTGAIESSFVVVVGYIPRTSECV